MNVLEQMWLEKSLAEIIEPLTKEELTNIQAAITRMYSLLDPKGSYSLSCLITYIDDLPK